MKDTQCRAKWWYILEYLLYERLNFDLRSIKFFFIFYNSYNFFTNPFIKKYEHS